MFSMWNCMGTSFLITQRSAYTLQPWEGQALTFDASGQYATATYSVQKFNASVSATTRESIPWGAIAVVNSRRSNIGMLPVFPADRPKHL
jgi:hypothetical protein